MKTESYISMEGDVTLPTGKSSGGPQTLRLPLPLVLVLSIFLSFSGNKPKTAKLVNWFLFSTPSSSIDLKANCFPHSLHKKLSLIL